METNTFSPMRTGIQTFADDVLWRPGDVPGENLGIFAPLLAAMQQRAQDSWEIIRGTVAFCSRVVSSFVNPMKHCVMKF